MTKRSVGMVILLTIITFGIYFIVWMVKTKNEANRAFNAGIPTAWLMIVPIANLWWQWKWCKGVELATRKELSQVISFILLFLLSIIGVAIIQSKINEAIDQGHGQGLPEARVA
ncbi:MAG TPA: DUF4234 domain-containing protein [Kofleriaceae bacterium]|nr:DUF4234 domain-containing protein [Kofleriaceae bacterium]